MIDFVTLNIFHEEDFLHGRQYERRRGIRNNQSPHCQYSDYSRCIMTKVLQLFSTFSPVNTAMVRKRYRIGEG